VDLTKIMLSLHQFEIPTHAHVHSNQDVQKYTQHTPFPRHTYNTAMATTRNTENNWILHAILCVEDTISEHSGFDQ